MINIQKHNRRSRQARLQAGFTIFFATLVASLALAIGLAIYDITVRQLSLSTTVTQSQYAIFAADSGIECALYWDSKYQGGGSAFTGSYGAGTPKVIVLTSGTSWTVPSDWNNGANTIEVIGGGGGGSGGLGMVESGSGGGGGAYSKVSNVTLTPNASVSYNVGSAGTAGAAGGSPRAGSGGDTYFCSASSGCSTITDTNVKTGAKGGQGGALGSPGIGGGASSGIGTIRYSGGSGGTDGGSGGSGGGGAAGGPGGNGGVGGTSIAVRAGAGGGGAGGGGAGGPSISDTQPGLGGNGTDGVSGGQNVGENGTASLGYSGGGGAGSWSRPGNGGNGKEWSNSAGSGGGGGGAGNTYNASFPGGAGGLYGGGGGGGGQYATVNHPGGAGGQGVIVITYNSTGDTSAATGVNCGSYDITAVGTPPVPWTPAPTGWGPWTVVGNATAATTTFVVTFAPYSYCALVEVGKFVNASGVIQTTVLSHGFNTCAANAQNQIERELKAIY